MIDTIPYSTDQKPKNNKKLLLILIGIVIIVGLVIRGVVVNQQSKKSEESTKSVVEEQEPSPTEKPIIDKETVKIQILNGTGTPGQAGIAADALKESGYSSDNIKTSNADEFDNTVTTIAAKEGFEEVANDIKDSLSASFEEINIDSSSLEADNEYDIVITTGGKIYEATTPTAKPDETTTSTPIPTSTVSPTPTNTPTPTP